MSIPIGARITYRYHLVCPLNIRLVMTATVNNTVAIRFNKFKKVFIFHRFLLPVTYQSYELPHRHLDPLSAAVKL